MEKKKVIIFLSALALLSFLSYQKVFATVPTLKEGTYLTGQTLSVWPSWSVLGSALGQALPVDPINRLAPAGTCENRTDIFCVSDSNCPALAGTTTLQKCILHDQITGWSTVDRRFSFACNSESYAYRYVVAPSSSSYTVRARFEDTGLSPVNLDRFVSDFISTTIIKVSTNTPGVCYFNEEISTIESGRCGDGKLNLQRGEQCDPPGRVEYQANCVGNLKNLTVCNSSCQWVASTTPCNSLSKCGNGRKEAGEICDEGALNGRYNHCNTTCSGDSTLGKCGNGVIEQAYEICDPGTPGLEKYSLTAKAQSCSWDCQNWGPYCGDKIVQSQHGEGCDGSQTCSIGGRQGTKVCTDTCKKEDKDVIAWWSFESLKDSNNQNELQSVDVSLEGLNDALCEESSCPRLVDGKFGKALEFGAENFTRKFLRVPERSSLEVKEAISVEAWVKPTNNEDLYQRVVEQGGAQNYTGFDLEINASSTKHTARFNLWNDMPNGVDSESSIPLNVWTHLLATYERDGENNIIKMYVNGILESTKSFSSTLPIMEKPTGDLFIGRSGSDGNPSYFFGSLDEVKIYPRVLSAEEARNNFQTGWLCVVGTVPPPIAENIPASCGNNIVDANEACDRGSANNGRACTTTYGQPCSYCSANCQNVVDVQPLEYCGNGIIEQREKCDVLSTDGLIFSAATSSDNYTSSVKNQARNGFQELACSAEPYVAHTLKKGTKTCGDCVAGVIRNCVTCGLDQNGVSISGGIINVLATSTGVQDPLFTRELTSSSLRLAIGTCFNLTVDLGNAVNACDRTVTTSPLIGQSKKDVNSQGDTLKNYILGNPYEAGNALINSNPVCSTDTDPTKKYLMYINRDYSRPIGFPVVAQPQTWQYDMILSPVISSTLRNKDLRVVVSWVGQGEFYGGILNPFVENSNPEVTAPSYCNLSGTCPALQKKYSTGINYYSTPNSDWYGVWYHGFNSTLGQTKAESFTINTGAMSGNTYSFFVKSPGSPIRQFRNTARLKVDIYLPENGKSAFHFGVPAKTYYFNASAPSDNPNAKYWHVFNINKPALASTVSTADIIAVNTIFTGPAQFKYFNPLVRDINFVEDPNNPSDNNATTSEQNNGSDQFAPLPDIGTGNDELNPNPGGGGPVMPPFGGQPPSGVQ